MENNICGWSILQDRSKSQDTSWALVLNQMLKSKSQFQQLKIQLYEILKQQIFYTAVAFGPNNCWFCLRS